jgi:acyl-CoA thioesterase I
VSSRVKRRVLTPALLLLLLAVTLVTVQLVERAGAGTSYCARHSAQSDRRSALVSGSGSPVTVVGDSWSVGLGLDRLADSWPSRLPGRVTVEGFSGSGFSRTASPCGDESFGTRAAAITPRGLVVVEGGLNDYDRSTSAITLGFARTLRALDGHRVVVVGPAAAPSRAAAVPRVDRLLSRLAAANDVPYVATSDLRLPYLSDRLHLTAEGHVLFGDAVAQRLAALGLVG